MKKSLFAGVFVMLALCIASSVYAKDIKVIIEGEELETDTPPVIMYDRVMLPVRAIFEGVGAQLAWDDQTRTLIGTKNGHVAVMTIDDRKYAVDGEEHTMSIAPIILDGRTFASARYVAEAFGYTVEWDKYERVVTINKDVPDEEPEAEEPKEEEEVYSTPVTEVTPSVYEAARSDIKKAADNYSLGTAYTINNLKLVTVRDCKIKWERLIKKTKDEKYVSYCSEFYDILVKTAKRIDDIYSNENYRGVREIMDNCLKDKNELEAYAEKFLVCETFAQCRETLAEADKFYSNIKTSYSEYE